MKRGCWALGRFWRVPGTACHGVDEEDKHLGGPVVLDLGPMEDGASVNCNRKDGAWGRSEGSPSGIPVSQLTQGQFGGQKEDI